MKEASLNKRHTYPAASALQRIVTVALLILAPVVLASAQSSGPPSDSASAGRSRAEDGATRISSDSETDPISLEAIQEGVKNFELRRSEMDDTPSNAAHAAAAAERRARWPQDRNECADQSRGLVWSSNPKSRCDGARQAAAERPTRCAEDNRQEVWHEPSEQKEAC